MSFEMSFNYRLIFKLRVFNICSTKSSNDVPIAFAAIGDKDVWVMPGMALISKKMVFLSLDIKNLPVQCLAFQLSYMQPLLGVAHCLQSRLEWAPGPGNLFSLLCTLRLGQRNCCEAELVSLEVLVHKHCNDNFVTHNPLFKKHSLAATKAFFNGCVPFFGRLAHPNTDG